MLLGCKVTVFNTANKATLCFLDFIKYLTVAYLPDECTTLLRQLYYIPSTTVLHLFMDRSTFHCGLCHIRAWDVLHSSVECGTSDSTIRF